MNYVKVDLWFPDYSNTEIEVSFDELMIWLAVKDIYLEEFKDENEPNPFYKIDYSCFQSCDDGKKLLIWLDYSDKRLNKKDHSQNDERLKKIV